ncbi:MAG: pyridoxamine kinase [Oscillospiraceae bacterium]|jgi:pyridoxine kinase|nr:pyridoxamine kinase [Oscillospiraceae bacterium]
MIPRRVLAIHDLSGVGKCSLTTALPILSCMGHEVAALPTAVLSTHTGGIDGYTYRDLTCDMRRIIEHWLALGLSFDAIYSGFMSSAEQMEILTDSIPKLKGEHTLILVDPVMGDGGAIYKTYTPAMVSAMKKLVTLADIITPNRTEAAILTGAKYDTDFSSAEDILAVCRALSDMGPRYVIISDVNARENQIGAAVYSRETHMFDITAREYIEGTWHGTGDIFASVLLGGMLNGRNVYDACRAACDFTHAAILQTKLNGTDTRFGIAFEPLLKNLTVHNESH